MSTSTTITIEATAADLLPAVPEDDLLGLLGLSDGIEGSVTDFRASDRPRWVVDSYDEKYGLPEIHGKAAMVSALFPAATVTVDEEWDARDADEQGAQGVVYQAGEAIRRGTLQMVWRDLRPLPIGTKVLRSGYTGFVVGREQGMNQVRLASGLVLVPTSELVLA